MPTPVSPNAPLALSRLLVSLVVLLCFRGALRVPAYRGSVYICHPRQIFMASLWLHVSMLMCVTAYPLWSSWTADSGKLTDPVQGPTLRAELQTLLLQCKVVVCCEVDGHQARGTHMLSQLYTHMQQRQQQRQTPRHIREMARGTARSCTHTCRCNRSGSCAALALSHRGTLWHKAWEVPFLFCSVCCWALLLGPWWWCCCDCCWALLLGPWWWCCCDCCWALLLGPWWWCAEGGLCVPGCGRARVPQGCHDGSC